MSKTPESLSSLNRHQRRAEVAASRQTLTPALANFHAARQLLQGAEARKNETLLRHRGEIMTTVAYREGSSLVSYLNATRNTHTALERVATQFDQQGRKILRGSDIYGIPTRGLSLADIEQMGSPLAKKDISQINDTVRTTLFRRFTTYQDIALSALYFLPGHEYIYGDLHPLPVGLKPLRDRLRSYLDYYMPIYTGEADENSLNLMTLSAIWVGGILHQALANYVPAKLGILPSSAEKLYRANGGRLSSLMTRRGMMKAVRAAYRPDSLPVQLAQYQHYDPQADKKLSKTLGDHYKKELAEDYSGSWQSASLTQLGDGLDKVRDDFFRDVRKSADGSLVFPTDGHPLIAEVIATAHQDRSNTPYRSTQIFIAKLRDGQHLTLEVNGDRYLYGIPPALGMSIMHVGGLLARDIIGPVIAGLNRHHPKAVVIESRLAPVPKVKSSASLPEFDMSEPEQPVIKKRKVSMLAAFQPSAPDLPTVQAPVKPAYQVYYDRGQIRRDLGKKASWRDVDRVVAGLERFARGEKRGKDLVGDHTDGLFSIRIGDRRVILEKVNPNEFAYVAVPTRQTLETHIYH